MVLEQWRQGWLGGQVRALDPDQGLVSSVLIVVLMVERCTFFRLFTFLLDKNGQLNYNIDITLKAGII